MEPCEMQLRRIQVALYQLHMETHLRTPCKKGNYDDNCKQVRVKTSVKLPQSTCAHAENCPTA
eukprot:5944305-Amphidinium_carterae.1